MMDKREKELFELLKAHPDGLRLREMGLDVPNVYTIDQAVAELKKLRGGAFNA